MTKEFMKELKLRNPIEEVISSYISFQPSGKKYVACCPFHNEKMPSFTVFPENGSYYCFGCGAGGDVITFIRKHENLGYKDAVQLLALRSGLVVPEDKENRGKGKDQLITICREAVWYYREMLYTQGGAAALEYAQKRGLSKEILNKFGIGFVPRFVVRFD